MTTHLLLPGRIGPTLILAPTMTTLHHEGATLRIPIIDRALARVLPTITLVATHILEIDGLLAQSVENMHEPLLAAENVATTSRR